MFVNHHRRQIFGCVDREGIVVATSVKKNSIG